MPDAVRRATDAHRRRWGAPTLVSRAPGRVNLIGEHTDYNDGFALPMALPFDTAIALSSTGDPASGPIVVESSGFGTVELDPGTDPRTAPSWAHHIAGVVALLDAPTGGWRATIETDIPTGASLSSSAALEVALINALLARDGQARPPIDVARLGQRVENEIVGLQSGIMDQFISAGAVAGHASLMDCRSLTLTPAPLPDGVVIAVMDTKTRRVLADAGYDDRRAACERAVAVLDIPSLRDATLDDVARLDDELLRRRARHVVTENERTLEAVAAMEAGDIVRLGELMNASHVSLRDDYEVAGAGQDAIVEVALGAPGCLGARMTGGGFAGCSVALVEADRADEFVADVIARYDHEGHTAEVWCCEPAPGASVETPA